ncbi:MAG: threonine/serine dehydratase [Gemmatimonadales bacterium]|nr:threonine/serine dehydratase [Gemmatimonadales bacterium]
MTEAPATRVGDQDAPREEKAAHLVVSLESVREAARGLEGVAVRTPLIHAPGLARLVGEPVALKGEHLQPVGAFKIRGAYTAISRLSAADRVRGVITYSSGNHGQAVAYAAARLGTRAVVVMPDHAPAIKVEGVKRHGGEVRMGGPTSATRREKAETTAQAEGLTIIPPFDDFNVIAGQATCSLEILEQAPDVATLIVPVGGGGLLAGACIVVAALRPDIQVIGVEPTGAAKLAAAMAAGSPVPLDRTESIADGLLPLAIGSLTFPIIRPVVGDTVQVNDAQITEAVRVLSRECGIRAEPSGAATAAALLAGAVRPSGPTVAIVSGGNVDPTLFQRLVDA